MQYIVPLIVLAAMLAGRQAFPAFVSEIKHRSFDYFQRIKPRKYEPEKLPAPVHVIDIDEDSLAEYGQWPWPRTFIAQLVDTLRDYGVKVIAFDSVFPEPDRTSPNESVKTWPKSAETEKAAKIAKSLPDNDKVFAKSIAKGGVVLGFSLTTDYTDSLELGYSMKTGQKSGKYTYAESGKHFPQYITAYTGATVNLPVLEASADGLGSFNFMPETDGVLRKAPMIARKIIMDSNGKPVDSSYIPSLSAEILRVFQGETKYGIKYSDGSGESARTHKDVNELDLGMVNQQTLTKQNTGVKMIRIGKKYELETDNAGRIWVYFTKEAPGRFISVKDIMQHKTPPEQLKGGIAIIGTSAAGLKDLRNTVLNPTLPGVAVHANVIEQVLLGIYLEQPDWTDGLEFSYTLFFSLILIVLLPRIGAIPKALWGVGGIAVMPVFSWLLFVNYGYLLEPVCPMATIAAVFVLSTVIGYRMTETEKKRVRTAFGHYMHPAMVEELAAHPEKLRLGGEMRNMTILFCDIRGFTTISEQYDSVGLTRVINRFLTPMTTVIMDRKGCIDKYIGDCIMAFWNAPIDDSRHILNSCESALVMQEELARLNKVWEEASKKDGTKYLPINIGVGLNTDDCCVGNLGSDQRFNYSVLGDGVNLASRLEGQSKAYGVKIVIGPKTNDGAEGFATLELDLIKVKGKTRPVNIYTLLGRREMLESQEFRTQKDAHDGMISAYRSADFARAEELLAVCRSSFAAAHGLGKLYDLYASRIEAFKANPPEPGWDGTYTATSK